MKKRGKGWASGPCRLDCQNSCIPLEVIEVLTLIEKLLSKNRPFLVDHDPYFGSYFVGNTSNPIVDQFQYGK